MESSIGEVFFMDGEEGYFLEKAHLQWKGSYIFGLEHQQKWALPLAKDSLYASPTLESYRKDIHVETKYNLL